MQEFLLTTFETEHGSFFEDYLTNKQKRFQTFLSDESFWKDYVSAYKWAKESGSLIVRAKIIEDNKFTLFQIWKSESARNDFDKKVNEGYFLSNFNFAYTRTNQTLSLDDAKMLIKGLLTRNAILQWVHPDYRISGMVIGDPLKNDSLIKV